jgi:hypothetical protein
MRQILSLRNSDSGIQQVVLGIGKPTQMLSRRIGSRRGAKKWVVQGSRESPRSISTNMPSKQKAKAPGNQAGAFAISGYP